MTAMDEQYSIGQRDQPLGTHAGVQMFKDHIASMRSGPWQLGGAMETSSTVEDDIPQNPV